MRNLLHYCRFLVDYYTDHHCCTTITHFEIASRVIMNEIRLKLPKLIDKKCEDVWESSEELAKKHSSFCVEYLLLFCTQVFWLNKAIVRLMNSRIKRSRPYYTCFGSLSHIVWSRTGIEMFTFSVVSRTQSWPILEAQRPCLGREQWVKNNWPNLTAHSDSFIKNHAPANPSRHETLFHS